MKTPRFFTFLALAFLALSPSRAPAVIIDFQVFDLGDASGPGGDLWEYRYAVSDPGALFTEHIGFSIAFSPALFRNLENPPPVVNADWNAITLQPDAGLQSDGFYDALALTNQPSLASAFTARFVWLGSAGTSPGAQPFAVNEFNASGNFVGVLQSGTTTVPEPGTAALLVVALAARLASRRRLRVLLLVCACAVPAGVFAQAATDLVLDGIEKIGERRVTRTVFEYTYRARVQNDGARRYLNVHATVAATASGLTLSDNALTFGDVLVSANAPSSDTFVFQFDRVRPFDPAALHFTFTGTAAPPAVPALTNLTAPASIIRGQTGTVGFDFADVDGDIAVATLTRSDALGTSSGNLPAKLTGLVGASGHATLTLQTGDLPFGAATLSVKLRDGQGLESATASAIIQIIGAANTGTPPNVVSFAPAAGSFGRPSGALDRAQVRCALTLADADGDLATIRVRLTDPFGATTVTEEPIGEFALGGNGGTTSRSLLTLSNVSPTGNYTIQVTPFDRNGHAGTPASATVPVVSFGGAVPALHVTSFSPTSGAPGTEVQIFGQGFSTAATAVTLVELGEVPCEIVSATASQLNVLIPVGVRRGAFTLRNPDGSTAIAATNFQAIEHIFIAPTADEGMPEISVGATLAFSARVGSFRADRSVVWLVNGVAGGNATFGTISAAGIYTAPVALPVPPADTVQISASLTANAAVVSATTAVALRPPPATPGAARILGAAGGAVSAVDFRSRVSIPAGALAGDTTVTARTLPPVELPEAGPGRRTLGAAEFGPAGTTFATPVAVAIPLTVFRPPGTPLRLRFFQQASGTFVDEGITAFVGENGDVASAMIAHFSIPVVDEAAPASPPTDAPTITSIVPAEVEEGARQPMRLAGTGLSGDLRIELRNPDGTPAGNMLPETLIPAGDRAGFVLDGAAIPQFDGGTREFRVRLVRPNGAFAEISFTVRGLPEFIVESGETLELSDPAPLRVSRVSIGPGARVKVRSGFLDLASLGEVQISGTIDASGARGRNGDERIGGAAGAVGAVGGRGGDGRNNEVLVPPNFLGPLPINFGQNGSDPVGVEVAGFQLPPARQVDNLTRSPRGLGGVPGTNSSIDPVSAIGSVLECVFSLGIACPDAVRQLIEQVRNIVAIADGSVNGKRGLGAPGLSPLPAMRAGGGGGGGGGKLTVNAILGGVEIFGGGGGAGGDDGTSVRLRTARGLTGPAVLDSANPIVTVRGGDGGDGSTKSTLLVTGPFHVEIHSEPGADAFSGGGGGGGRTGLLNVSAAEGIFLDSPQSQLVAGGGNGGRGGVTVVNAQTGFAEEEYTDNAASDAEGVRGSRVVHTPAFDPLTFRPRVTGRSVLHLQSERTFDDGPIRFTVRGEAPGQQLTVVARYDSSTRRYAGNAVLFQGFNSMTDPGLGLASNDPLAAPRLLLLGIDSDGDGLTDEDEADFHTNPVVVDTDGDGLGDGQEIAFGSDPLTADADGDGLSDSAELAANTDPRASDSDGDGFQDGAEVFLGSNPTLARSIPTDIAAGTLFGSSTGALALLNPANGQNLGLLGRPNGLLSFGLAFDELATLYTANFDRLAEYDPLAMTNTPIGNFGSDGGAPIRCNTLAYNPADHWLYGIELGPSPGFALTAQLLRINPFTGVATRVGAPGAFALHALVFSGNGMLFATAEGSTTADRFIELAPATGALVRTIGMTNAAPLYGLAIDAQGRIFAAQPLANNTTTLHTLAAATGLATPVTTVPRPVFDLDFQPRRAPAFGPPVLTPTAPNTLDFSLSAGDLDGDGDVDAIVATSIGFQHKLSVRHGDRTGAFTEVAQLSLPGFSSVISSSVALADFNSDGRPDILADNPENSFPGPQSLVLFLANPAAPGGYNPAVAVGASAHLAGRLTVTNLNPLDDVFPDIVSGTADGDDTFVAFGNGAGGFGTPVNVGGAGRQTNGLAADLNGDGFPDLILQEQINPGFRAAIAVRLNDGHGNFAAATIHDPAPLERLEKFAVGDFDGDGRPDVAVLGRINLGAGTYGDGLVLLRQNAVGAFAVSAVVSLDGSTAERSGVAVGDLTGDGLADVVIVAVEPATFVRRMKVFAGRANGTLRAGSVTVLPGNAYDLDLAEVNSDGRFDVIVSGQSGLQTYRTEPSFAALPVPSLLPAFMQWSFAHFGYAEADALGDPDGDGLATLLEYALNLRPDRADAAPFAVTRAASAYGERLRLFLQRDPAHRDVKIEVQAASQVTGPWTTIATSTLGAAFTGPGYVGGDSATPGLKTIEIRDTVDIASTPARFLRVKVTR